MNYSMYFRKVAMRPVFNPEPGPALHAALVRRVTGRLAGNEPRVLSGLELRYTRTRSELLSKQYSVGARHMYGPAVRGRWLCLLGPRRL